MLQHLVEDVLDKREDIIQRPVHDQTGGPVIQQDQEQDGQYDLLDLAA